MLHIVVCMRLEESYRRIKSSFDERIVEFEEYLSSLDELQEKLSYSEYEVAVIDENIWWKDEAVSLLQDRGVEIISFSGDFENTVNEITQRIPPYEEEKTDFNYPDIELKQNQDYSEDKEDKEEKEITKEPVVIVKEVKVPEIIYKSRNIKQRIISVLSMDNMTIRDSFACNLSATLAEAENERVLIVDITKFNNCINHLKNEFSDVDPFSLETLNPNTLRQCASKVEGFNNLDILHCNNSSLTKKKIKTVLYAARDYDCIVFVLESDINNVPVKFTLNVSHSVYLIAEPLYLAAKNNLALIKVLLSNGQVEENIVVIITEENVLDKEAVEYMYKSHNVFHLNKALYLDAINNSKLISNKKEVSKYKEIVGYTNDSKGFIQKFLRR